MNIELNTVSQVGIELTTPALPSAAELGAAQGADHAAVLARSASARTGSRRTSPSRARPGPEISEPPWRMLST